MRRWRAKPAFISTLASMGMAISALEVRGGREDHAASRKAPGRRLIVYNALCSFLLASSG